MYFIETKDEVLKFLSEYKRIKVYGARFKLRLFLEMLKILGYSSDYIEEILVTDMNGNLDCVEGIPVHVYQKDNFEKGDMFYLALAEDYLPDVSQKLEKDGFHTISISEKLIEYQIVDNNYIYQDVYAMLKEFTADFPDNISGLNTPEMDNKKYAWTCWWQGMEEAPDLIKACVNSMIKYLPQSVELVVITKDNYKEYVSFPEYILDKIEQKKLTLTTFSDILRASLLYKYGGIWIDATMLFTGNIPLKCWDYGIFTIRELRYCLPFIGGRAGQKLYQFLMEGFFYYYKKYDTTKYYLLVTYILDIAMNTYTEIKEEYNKLPIQSDNVTHIDNFDILSNCMNEEYTLERYQQYMEGIYFHKLQHRFDRFGDSIHNKDNIYHYILSEYLS